MLPVRSHESEDTMKLLLPLTCTRHVWILTLAAATTLGACGEAANDEAASADTAASAPSGDARVEPTSAESDQVEKMKPAPGTGNVQGRVLYNGKPAAGIEVTLCTEFSRWMSGCGGTTYNAKTDENGEYVITNVKPGEYAALLAKVFDTESYVFATQGAVGLESASYNVVADKTIFVDPTNLFKSDLKVKSPKAGSQVAATGWSLGWDPYPDAAYYKFSLFADSATVMSPYINERVDSSAFALAKELPLGGYRIEVEAFNENDVKLAESADDIKFTVK
jgi:hypothetical protein